VRTAARAFDKVRFAIANQPVLAASRFQNDRGWLRGSRRPGRDEQRETDARRKAATKPIHISPRLVGPMVVDSPAGGVQRRSLADQQPTAAGFYSNGTFSATLSLLRRQDIDVGHGGERVAVHFRFHQQTQVGESLRRV
jgi:hypothetical protein